MAGNPLYLDRPRRMDTVPKISFEDASVAFKYKSNLALRKANFIFALINHPWISAIVISIVKIAPQGQRAPEKPDAQAAGRGHHSQYGIWPLLWRRKH